MAEIDSHADTDPQSGSTLVLLGLVVVLFSVVVGYGWVRLLAEELSLVPAVALGSLITLIAILLAQQVARALIARRSAAGSTGRVVFLYSILFVISALGTINAAFYNFEGSSVLQQVVDDAEQHLAALDSATATGLRNPEQEGRAAEVERLLVQLDSEIRNPTGNCGVGPEARSIIAQISAILPQFRQFSRREGNQPSCADVALANLSRQYRDTALAMLNIDPAQRSRVQLRSEITARNGQALRQLMGAETQLARGRGFGEGYESAQLALENAATTYADGRQRLAAVSPEAIRPLPAAIDVSRARYLGSITAMPGTLAERLDYWTTWAYFVTAILLDFFLVFLFGEALQGNRPRPIIAEPRARDPQFLWINEGS